MQQYFVDQSLKIHDTVMFDKEQAHHIHNVLRMKEGNVVRVVDGNETAYFAHIRYENGNVLGIVDEAVNKNSEPNVKVTLAMGLIKGEKWDWLLQKAAECGVWRIIPMTSNRCVVKAKEDKVDKKLERWNKITLEACEQCKRTHRVEVTTPMDLKAITELDADCKLIAYEDADCKANNLADVFKQNSHLRHAIVMIGPEGGFSSEEVALAKQAGFLEISLGCRILRAETAAIFALNAFTYHYDLLGGSHETAD